MTSSSLIASIGGAVALTMTLGAVGARAADQPIDAQRLLLRVASNGSERLLFVARGGDLAIDAPDGGGSSLELFSHSTGEHAVIPFGPPEEGGWMVRSRGKRGPVVVFRAAGKSRGRGRREESGAGVVQLVHRVNRNLELLGSSVGLAMDVPHSGVGVRLTVGDVRLCALFDAATVRRSRAGFFSAVGARAASLVDCSDAALAGPTVTTSTETSTTTTTTTTTSSTSTTATTMPGLLIGNPTEFPSASDHNPGFLVGTRIDIPLPSTITHFGVIGKVGGPHVRLALYNDGGGEPTTLVVGTSDDGLEAGRMEVSVPATAVGAGSYWLMAMYDSPASVGLDSSDPLIPVRFADAPYGSGLPPFLFFSETFFGQQYNYYVRIVP